jgi:hypothetical protein
MNLLPLAKRFGVFLLYYESSIGNANDFILAKLGKVGKKQKEPYGSFY